MCRQCNYRKNANNRLQILQFVLSTLAPSVRNMITTLLIKNKRQIYCSMTDIYRLRHDWLVHTFHHKLTRQRGQEIGGCNCTKVSNLQNQRNSGKHRQEKLIREMRANLSDNSVISIQSAIQVGTNVRMPPPPPPPEGRYAYVSTICEGSITTSK